jgi:formamidopyrimidine-DNA glycosylase
MPELPEIEAYRRLAERTTGRVIASVALPDAWYVKGELSPAAVIGALEGERVTAADRIGKLLLLRTTGPTLGLRFGMTGRLLVDDRVALEHLEYGSAREEPAWDRVIIQFEPSGGLRVRDPRRLGGIQLDPDVDRLGLDALAVTPAQLRAVLGTSTAPLKARLMDQARVAGVGNLLADEILWRASLDPVRPAGSLSPPELRRLHRHLAPTIVQLLERGGSHTGDLQPHRRPGGVCPRDGQPLERRTVGGRTTWSCPRHQR